MKSSNDILKNFSQPTPIEIINIYNNNNNNNAIENNNKSASK